MDVLAALGLLVAVAVAASVIGVVIYRRVRSDLSTGQQSLAFSLSDLRRLRDKGQLTETEYRRARATIIGESQSSLIPDEDSLDTSASTKRTAELHGSDSDKLNA